MPAMGSAPAAVEVGLQDCYCSPRFFGTDNSNISHDPADRLETFIGRCRTRPFEKLDHLLMTIACGL